jgi:hypothetical protein
VAFVKRLDVTWAYWIHYACLRRVRTLRPNGGANVEV